MNKALQAWERQPASPPLFPCCQVKTVADRGISVAWTMYNYGSEDQVFILPPQTSEELGIQYRVVVQLFQVP